MVTIPRATLIAATERAIARTEGLAPRHAERLRAVAATTTTLGDNFNTRPACLAGQAFAWPFYKNGCSSFEHSTLVSFGVSLDGCLCQAGITNGWFGAAEVVDA